MSSLLFHLIDFEEQMKRFKQTDGFTLIELMIVVAIIAIIAAIAIPSILRSRMSANQTSAVSSLDTILKMNTQFRSNDSDNNQENDYWTENVWGLYGIKSAGNERIELFSRSLAEADYEGGDDQSQINSAQSNFSIDSSFTDGDESPKSGYYVSMFTGFDTSGAGGATNCDTNYDDGDKGSVFTNSNRFGVSAFPELYDSTGTKAYALDQGGDKFEIDAKSGDLSKKINGSDDTPNGTAGQTAPYPCRPSDDNLNSDWGTVG